MFVLWRLSLVFIYWFTVPNLLAQQQQQLAYAALAAMLRKDMPNVNDNQIRDMLPMIYNANPTVSEPWWPRWTQVNLSSTSTLGDHWLWKYIIEYMFFMQQLVIPIF